MTWYEDLAVGYPDIVKFVPSIGKSLEGRDMPAVHITASSSPRKYYFQCQIHARKYVSIARGTWCGQIMVADKSDIS